MTDSTPATAAGYFAFMWRRGQKPRLIGPFPDQYGANRVIRQYDAEDDTYVWTLQPEETAMTEPATAASEYELTVRFGAADDGQAERLARAWAGTIEAEFGATFVAVRKVVESD